MIYESTVYPGVTEEECVPVLEKTSGLTFNSDFFVGYSPERINPGDKEHTVEKILKVTSGSTPEVGKKVDALYASVIMAGTHLAPSIRVAEAANTGLETTKNQARRLLDDIRAFGHQLHLERQAKVDAGLPTAYGAGTRPLPENVVAVRWLDDRFEPLIAPDPARAVRQARRARGDLPPAARTPVVPLRERHRRRSAGGHARLLHRQRVGVGARRGHDLTAHL